MTLQQMHYAITIAEVGSFNKASEVLYLAQPSLTGAIRELEKELGVQIFHRSGKGVSLTNDGVEFLARARQLYQQYEGLLAKYGKDVPLKKKFGISTQHYSFAVKSFVELVKKYGAREYEFAIRETKTREVIEDVSTFKSEIGILYRNDFNGKAITKLLRANGLGFHPLISCRPYVYLWKGHPLARRGTPIRFEELAPYPCLSFEQGDNSSFYFAEEILSTSEYPQTIKANDRATMLNLMVGLGGYTLCSGIICEELNGDSYMAVPFAGGAADPAGQMEIGYITKKNMVLSPLGQAYIEELERYLGVAGGHAEA